MDDAPRDVRSITGDLKPPNVADHRSLGEIARGAQGAILCVYDTNLNRQVAMKVLDASLQGQHMHRRRFVEEAQITAQLDHPNVPAVHRIGVDDNDHLYFTMKLVHGKTLEQTLVEDVTGMLYQHLQVFVTVCNAVAFAHDRGVVHRDLKPDNIMVGSHGQVYVMDWGIARIVGAERPSGQDHLPPVRVWGAPESEQGLISGTPEYMAPEQAAGRIDLIDQRTDVFALGAILYRIISGRPPYTGQSSLEILARASQAEIEPPHLVSDRPVPPALATIAARAMQREPQHRYQNVDELRDEVQAFLRSPTALPSQRYAPGARIFLEGTPGDCAYVILQGHVRIFKTVAGRTMVLRELGPGTAFGETAIFSSQPRSASVEAIDEVTVVVISRTDLEKELAATSMLGPLVRQLAVRFRQIDEELTKQRSSASSIVHAALLYVAMHGVGAERKVVSLSQLRAHLCSAFGCEPEQVYAALRSMSEADVDIQSDLVAVRMDHYAR